MRYPNTAATIKRARLKKGLSQEKAANQLGCSRLQWINWEQGLHRPTRHLAALAELLELSADELEVADEDRDATVMPLSREHQEALDGLTLDQILLYKIKQIAQVVA